jgi:hypothetical protein
VATTVFDSFNANCTRSANIAVVTFSSLNSANTSSQKQLFPIVAPISESNAIGSSPVVVIKIIFDRSSKVEDGDSATST